MVVLMGFTLRMDSFFIADIPEGLLWKIPPFLMGKLTISMAMFNSFLYVYQAGYIPLKSPFSWLNPIKPPLKQSFSWGTMIQKLVGHDHS